MNKVYDQKTYEQELRKARWELFIRFATAVSIWTSIVLIFGGILVLLTH